MELHNQLTMLRAWFPLVLVGLLITPTLAATAGSTPSRSSGPPASGIYGAAIKADAKANLRIGGPRGRRVAHRFRAGTSSALISIRFAQRGGSGYSSGTGGTLRISIQSDDGSGRPSGTVLAAVGYVPGNAGGSWSHYDRVTFPSPATLTRGRVYHVVFENVDASPTSNYVSVNDLFVYGSVLVPRQPYYSDAEYAVLEGDSGSWALRGGYTGVMDLAYADGSHDGMGYIEAMIAKYGAISGASDMVREAFTVSGGDRTVTAVSVRVRRSYGTSPLTMTLETSGGALIESVAVPASSVPISAPGGDNGGAVWVTAAFDSPHVLSDGASYSLRLSTAASTEYTTFPLREGTDIGFESRTFTDGSGQFTTNGSSWTDLYQWSPVDLQFYFR